MISFAQCGNVYIYGHGVKITMYMERITGVPLLSVIQNQYTYRNTVQMETTRTKQ